MRQDLAAQNANWTINPKRDKSIAVPKVFEFQFYKDYDATQRLAQEITKMIESFATVPESLKA